MTFFAKKNKEQINYLELTPFTIYNHETEESTGLVTVLVPRFTSKFWSKHLLPMA